MRNNYYTQSLNPEVGSVEDYLESIIQDVEAKMAFSQYVNVDMKDFFEINKTRNIDYKDKSPIEVTVKNSDR